MFQSTFIMSEQEYLNDIREIKNLMNRSSRFISLSGLSGIFAGIYAIIGALVSYYYIFPSNSNPITLHSWNFKFLLIVLALVALLSIITALYLTTRKAKKNNEKIWDDTTKRLLINFQKTIPRLAWIIPKWGISRSASSSRKQIRGFLQSQSTK